MTNLDSLKKELSDLESKYNYLSKINQQQYLENIQLKTLLRKRCQIIFAQKIEIQELNRVVGFKAKAKWKAKKKNLYRIDFVIAEPNLN